MQCPTKVFTALTASGRSETSFRSRKVRLAVLTVMVVAVLAFAAVTLLWDPFALFRSTTSTQQVNQILFVGAGFNQTNTARDSTIGGDFFVNMTTPGLMQFTLDDETYYLPGSVGNGSTVSSGQSVHTFRSGFIEIDGNIFNFVSMEPCTATVATIQTNGSTVTAFATCVASTTSTVRSTGFIHVSTAGVWQFHYSLDVPSNATIGTYLVDILIQNSSDQNLANMSNNLVYVLTVNVTE